MVVAEEIYNTSNVVMVWELNEDCVGHYLEIFRPLQNVTFISFSQQTLFIDNAVAHFGPSYASFPEILQRFKMEISPPVWHKLRRDKYSLFIPVPFVLHEVFQFVKNKRVCECVGVHVRHTDLETRYRVTNPNHSSNVPFFDFIDTHPEDQCVYLMTDNPISQRVFQRRYGSRLLVYDTVRDTSVHHEANHRFTSLFHTIVDVLITAYTQDFMGTVGSSLSELVTLMNVTFVTHSNFYTSCNKGK
jgi:hypothetical protein